jgi:hypothetical protein
LGIYSTDLLSFFILLQTFCIGIINVMRVPLPVCVHIESMYIVYNEMYLIKYKMIVENPINFVNICVNSIIFNKIVLKLQAKMQKLYEHKNIKLNKQNERFTMIMTC